MSNIIPDFDQRLRAHHLAEFSKIVSSQGPEAGEQYLLQLEWKWGYNPFNPPEIDYEEENTENTPLQKFLLFLLNIGMIAFAIIIISLTSQF